MSSLVRGFAPAAQGIECIERELQENFRSAMLELAGVLGQCPALVHLNLRSDFLRGKGRRDASKSHAEATCFETSMLLTKATSFETVSSIEV